MNFRLLCAFIAAYSLVLVSCKKPESTSQAAAPSVAPNSDSTINPDITWCTKGQSWRLGRWQTTTSDMFVSYCTDETTDSQGVYLYSKLDIRQEDLKNNHAIIWKLHDEVGNGLTGLKLYRLAFSLIDVDGSGDKASFFGYFFPSQGLDPVAVKFIAHSHGQEYSIKGQIPKSEDDSASYKMEYAPAFSKASPRLKSVSDSLLKDFVVKICQDSEFGIWAPVPPQVSRHD